MGPRRPHQAGPIVEIARQFGKREAGFSQFCCELAPERDASRSSSAWTEAAGVGGVGRRETRSCLPERISESSASST